MTTTSSLRDGAPVTALPPTAVRALPPAAVPRPPVAPAFRSVASTRVAHFNRWERVLLAAATIVGSVVLQLAHTVVPEPHRR